jgi:hypothetical protein
MAKMELGPDLLDATGEHRVQLDSLVDSTNFHPDGTHHYSHRPSANLIVGTKIHGVREQPNDH